MKKQTTATRFWGMLAVICAFSIGLWQIAFAQGSAMEQAIQTNILRDTFRAQVSIAEELRILNKTLRRIECVERLRNFGNAARHCAEGVETANEWSQ